MRWDPQTRAALIGAGATVLSVIAAVIGVLLKLAWDRKKHTQEHLLNLRRDVYLSAADSIASAFQSLVSLGGPSAKIEDIQDRFSGLSGVIGKIHILGNRRSVKTILELQQGFVRCYAKLGWEKAFIQQEEKQNQIDSNTIAIARLEKQRDDATANSDEKLASGLSKQISTLRNRDLKDRLELFDHQIALIKHTAAELTALEPLYSEAILALKADLGLVIDEDWYREEARRAHKATTETLEQVMRKVGELRDIVKKLGQIMEGSATRSAKETNDSTQVS